MPAPRSAGGALRSGPHPLAELGGRGARVLGAGDRARGGDEDRRGVARERRVRGPPGRRPGPRYLGRGRSSRASARAAGRSGAARWRRRPHPSRSAPTRPPAEGRAPATISASRSWSGPSPAGRSSRSAAPGLEVRTSANRPAPERSRRGDQRLERIAAEQRVHRCRVGAERLEHRLGVDGRRVRDVTALAVRDHAAGRRRGRRRRPARAPASRRSRGARSTRAAASPRRRTRRSPRSAPGTPRRRPPPPARSGRDRGRPGCDAPRRAPRAGRRTVTVRR